MGPVFTDCILASSAQSVVHGRNSTRMEVQTGTSLATGTPLKLLGPEVFFVHNSSQLQNPKLEKIFPYCA